jgi:hypothetical protein
MAIESAITSSDRIYLVDEAIRTANEQLREYNLEVGYPTQWPPKIDDSPDVMDQRPDVNLKMLVLGEWVDIDIIYLRQMPQEPEKLKTVAQLTDDIFKKALAHRDAMNSSKIYISSSGSKFDFSEVGPEQFSIDSGGYIRVGNTRIVIGTEPNYKPIKAADIRCHTISVVRAQGNVVVMNDEFDKFRTDGRKGIYCSMDKAIDIARESIVLDRQQEAQSYEKETGGSKYIPIQRSL